MLVRTVWNALFLLLLLNLLCVMPGRAAAPDDNIPRWIAALQANNVRARVDTEVAIIRQVKACMQSARLVAPLITCLKDAEPLVRTNGAIALACIKVFHREVDVSPAVLPLIAALRDEQAPVRTAAANALGNFGDPQAITPLVAALSDTQPEVVISTVRALRQFGDPNTAAPIAVLLVHPDAQVQAEAALTLGHMGDKRAVESLIGLLKTNNATEAAELLGNLGDTRAVEPLCAYLPTSKAKLIPIAALGKLRDPRAIDPLVKQFEGRDVQHAIRALKAIGDRRAVAALIALLKARVTPRFAPSECSVAVNTLKSLTSQDFGLDAAKWEVWWQAQTP